MAVSTGARLAPTRRKELEALAHQVRRDIIRSIACAGAGHPGGALGAAEFFAALYSEILNFGPEDLDRKDRDRFILSNGHICAGFYAVLARCGFLEVDELARLRKMGSHLQGHPARAHLPGLVEASSGPLGQGVSVANGLALAARLDRYAARVYCLVGDGELQEGQVWEALMTAAHYRLNNITLFVAYNGLQIDGSLDDVKRLEPMVAKFEAFGWNVLDIDGHDVEAIVGAAAAAGEHEAGPSVVVLRTVMGRGVPFMENNHVWHGGPLSTEQAKEALQALGPADGYQDFKITGSSNEL